MPALLRLQGHVDIKSRASVRVIGFQRSDAGAGRPSRARFLLRRGRGRVEDRGDRAKDAGWRVGDQQGRRCGVG